MGGSAAALTAIHPKPCLYSATDIIGAMLTFPGRTTAWSLEIMIASGSFQQDGNICAEIVERSECLAGGQALLLKLSQRVELHDDVNRSLLGNAFQVQQSGGQVPGSSGMTLTVCSCSGGCVLVGTA